LYNAADVIVVGRFAGKTSLAAVGSTGSLTNLIISLFMGLSVGASVAVAQYYGANRWKDVSEVVHTSMLISIISGVVVGLVGIFMSRTFLLAMDTPSDVIDKATLYMQIYFAGMPASMVYNFGSAILRAVGDTKRPLIFLTISGIVNVILNIISVIVFKMDVAGVAVATVISQIISAVLVVICLMRYDGACRLSLRSLKLHKDKLLQLVRIGLPAGLQSSLFSISNVLVQSSVNSFGSVIMAGNSAAANIEGFIWVSMNSLHQAALTFVGQNVGAKEYKRVKRAAGLCVLLVIVVGATLGGIALLLGRELLGIYAPGEEDVIGYGLIRLKIIAGTYLTCGIMDVFVGVLRGMGTSVVPMIVSVIGVCGGRIMWILTVFKTHRDLNILYISYPISWILTALIHLLCVFIVYKKVVEKGSFSKAEAIEA
jgi:putative MATE family efflux protein